MERLKGLDNYFKEKSRAKLRAAAERQPLGIPVMSEEEIRAVFKRSSTERCKDHVDYEPTCRTKINVAGPGAVRCWTPEKTLRALPEDWRRCSITPILTAKCIWFMQGGCGVTYQVDDCILVEKNEECPF